MDAKEDKKPLKFGKLAAWEDVVICVEPPEEFTEHGVAISPDAKLDASKQPQKGIVYAVGLSSDPKKVIDLKPGDLLFFERYTANVVNEQGVDYNFVRFRNIMGAKKQEK